MSAASSAPCSHSSLVWSRLLNTMLSEGTAAICVAQFLETIMGKTSRSLFPGPCHGGCPGHVCFVVCRVPPLCGYRQCSLVNRFLRVMTSAMFFWVLDLAALRRRWILNWWSQETLLCEQITEIPSAPTLEALGSVHSQDSLALGGKMLSAVFLTAAGWCCYMACCFSKCQQENGINWLLLVLKGFPPPLSGEGLLW